jgi:hypothetical protein
MFHHAHQFVKMMNVKIHVNQLIRMDVMRMVIALMQLVLGVIGVHGRIVQKIVEVERLDRELVNVLMIIPVNLIALVICLILLIVIRVKFQSLIRPIVNRELVCLLVIRGYKKIRK